MNWSVPLNLRIWIAVALLAAAVPLVGVISTSQPVSADHTTIELNPNALYLIPGGNEVLELWVRGLDDAAQLVRYDITLSYDPAVIRIESVEGGDAPFDRTPVFSVDTVNGEVTLNATQSTNLPSDEVLVARLNVSAVGELESSSTITFTNAELTNSSNQRISAAPGGPGSANIARAAVRVGRVDVSKGRSTTVPVTVSFSPKGGLAGYNISISYDPAIIKIDEILSGEPPFGGSPVFHVNEAEEFVNIVGFHGDRPGPVGRTVVLNMRVTGIERGTSRLGLTVKDLVDAVNTESWPAAAIDGSVRVLSASADVGSIPESDLASSSTEAGTAEALEGAVIADLTPGVFSELSLPNQLATLTFPAGAVTERGFVALKQVIEESNPPAPPGLDLRTVIEVTMLDSSGNLLTDVFLPNQATLRMSLPDATGGTPVSGDISIQRYEPVLARWLPLPTVVDPENKFATASVNRLSIFALTMTSSTVTDAAAKNPTEVAAASGGPTTTPADNPTPLAGTGEPDGGRTPALLIVLIVVAVLALGGVGYFVFRPKRGAIPG